MSDIVSAETQALTVLEAQPLDRSPAAVYLASLGSDKARRVQLHALRVIAGLLTGQNDPLQVNWSAIRFQHAAAVRSKLGERYSPATTNRTLSALRGVLKAAWRLGQLSEHDYSAAADVKGLKAERLPAGRALSPGEIAALMHSCENDTTPAGARDAALIACLYPAGLRREEVVALDLADFDPQTGALTVRHGKGDKERITYLESGAARAMTDWLNLRGDAPGALFWPVDKSGSLTARRLNNQAVYNVLAKRGELAGVADLSPHDLRRTFISDLLDAGADIATVAKLAGHASVITTQRYDRRPEAAKRQAVQLLHLPYRGRMV